MIKNIIMAVVVLLFLIPAALAAAPVWTAIPDQQITAGNTLTFTVTASDADGDMITLSIASAEIAGSTFTGNSNGTGTFTWTTNASQVGTHDVIFSASTVGANATREETFETARITVTAPATAPSLSPEEQEYNRVVAQFNDLEDDYSISKRRYERAVDDDERDIDDYAQELEDIDDDLADLEDDVEDLMEDIEDSNIDNRRELLDNTEDLQDDIERVRDRIDTLLNEENDEEIAGTTVSYTPPPPRAEPQPERTKVIIGTLDFPGGNMVNTVEQPDTWPETRKMVWIGAGVVVLIAVIIFLVALLVI